MKNLFYSAADKIGQKPDSILYRLPTWHPIYSMPFGQSEKDCSSVFVCSCPHLSSEAGGKIKENRRTSAGITLKDKNGWPPIYIVGL